MCSKFKDFFPIYQTNSQNKKEKIKQLSDEIEDNYETWADFESALGQYTLKFDKKTKKDFLNQIKDFETEFMDYLNLQEQTLSFEKSEEIAKIMLKALHEYYKVGVLPSESSLNISNLLNKYSNQQRIYNFINFNYTFALENCLKTIPDNVIMRRKHYSEEIVDRIGKIVHIHGDRNANPIIGLNDVTQIANEELAKDTRFTKYIVKPAVNELLRNGNDGTATAIVNNSQIICIYGMSLGETDKKWWTLILKWLNAVSERQLIIFAYDEKYKQNTQFDWIEKEDDIIDMLSHYSENVEMVENLRPRIHIAVHKNIFEIDLAKEHREIMDLAVEKVLANV